MEIGTWPFSLAYISPGEIDMKFVAKFKLELLGGYMGDYNPLRFFDPEPRWRTEWVNEEIREERHQRILEHLEHWGGEDRYNWRKFAKDFCRTIDHSFEKTLNWNPGLLNLAKSIKKKMSRAKYKQ